MAAIVINLILDSMKSKLVYNFSIAGTRNEWSGHKKGDITKSITVIILICTSNTKYQAVSSEMDKKRQKNREKEHKAFDDSVKFSWLVELPFYY